MWHDLYAPQVVADVTWSRQKITELSNIILSCASTTHRRALLMYGPSGCGKTASIAPIVHAVAPHATVDCHFMSADVLQRSVEQLEAFLFTSPNEHHHDLRGRREHATTTTNNHCGQVQLSVRVVKLLCYDETYMSTSPWQQSGAGGGASSIADVMLRCLQRMENASSQSALLAREDTASLPGSSLVIFIHTTHDSHSDKLNLNAFFGEQILRSPILWKFHCTPTTPTALRLRMHHILSLRRDSAQCRRTGGRRDAHVDDTVVNSIAATSNGDIRQALLQLQWAAIDIGVHVDGGGSGNTLAPAIARHNNGRPVQVVASSTECVDVDAEEDDEDQAVLRLVQLADDAASLRGSRSAASGTSARHKQPKDTARQRKSKSATIESLLDDALPAASGTVAAKQATKPLSLQKTAERIRDECIDVAHATARLLTQKYDASSVLSVLTVPPYRLMGYVATNMHHYFGPHQVEAFADCSAMLSIAEALVSPSEQVDTGGDGQLWGGGVAGRAGGTKAVHGESLALIGVHLFDRGYRVLHPNVAVPKTLLAQHPPPFMPMCFPRVAVSKDWWRQRGRKRCRQEEESAVGVEDDDVAVASPSLAAMQNVWRQRLGSVHQTTSQQQQQPSLLMVVDALRGTLMPMEDKCCSWDAVMLDMVPMAITIVLNASHASTMVAPTAGPHPTTERRMGLTSPQVPSQIKRTLFTLPVRRAATAVARTGPSKVSDLQVEALRVAHRVIRHRRAGSTAELSIRSERFELGSDDDNTIVPCGGLVEDTDPIEDV